jgi:putative endonuclease
LSLKILATYDYFDVKIDIIIYVLNKCVKPFHVKRFTGQHKILGNKGENVAQQYYQGRGCTLLSQNSRTRNSELDLVFMRDETIIFVEVKTLEIGDRSNLLGEDNFTRAKRFHMKRAIEQYIFKEKPNFKNIQIDLACVYYHTEKDLWTIKLYENLILE